jgi:hypothetical protein
MSEFNKMWVKSGGWAIDFLIGKVTREHNKTII